MLDGYEQILRQDSLERPNVIPVSDECVPVLNSSFALCIFLNDASCLTVQPDKKTQVDGKTLRHASLMMLFALEALNLAKRLIVVEVLEKANLEVFGTAAGKRVHGGERLPEGDPNWLERKLAEYRAYVAQGKGTIAQKVIEKRPGILKGMLVSDPPWCQWTQTKSLAYSSEGRA